MLVHDRNPASVQAEAPPLGVTQLVPCTPPPMVGSGWDAFPDGPDAPLAHHLAEWVTGSAVAPELAAANLESRQGWPVLEALAGPHLARLGGHASQYVTAPAARILRSLEPLADAGGWWCAGLDPLADWRPMAWGCFKPDAPRWDEKKRKPRKYEHPDGPPARLFWLRCPASIAHRVADRYGLTLPPEVADDTDGSAGAFWHWWAQTPALPLLLTEGVKKAAALLSIGVPAVALSGIWNGCPRTGPKDPKTGRRTGPAALLPELAGVPLAGREVWVLFDASDKPDPAEPLAANQLGHLLAAAGAVVRVGIVPGTHGKGADDHLAAGGSWEALAAALAPLAPLAPRPVLPWLREADLVVPAGQWLGEAGPLPSPDVASLVVIQAPMGCGKTTAIRAAVRELEGEGVQILAPYHRRALGQAGSDPERGLGVPWCPAPGSEERRLGVAACWDSWCPESPLQINDHTGSGGVMVLDEWAQALEHLLLSHGTALGKGRRAAALRTLAEQARRLRQTIAADAQLPDWAVRLLESLTGQRAYVIRSDHQPMAGRPLHAPEGFTTAAAAAKAFRVRLAELVDAGEPFLCWTSAQQCGKKNAPQTLAKRHRKKRPADLVDVIDSKTPELAAELAADPNGFAERRTAQARERGGSWALYCSPAISSGLSFSWDAETRQGWRPAAVIAFAGGRIAPEHVAQALARVRCPEVPSYVFAPEVCPGAALRVGSGSTDPAELIRHLRAVSDPLLGALQDGDDRGAFLQAWAELGAHRNRQRFAYRATIAGLLQREGWALQAPGPAHCPQIADAITAELQAIAEEAQAAEDAAVIAAPPLTALEAVELNRRRRSLDASEEAALTRFELAKRWGLGAAAPSLELLQADRDGLADRLRLGWILTTPEALALVPEHDRQQIAALDPAGRPFEPDRLRVTLASQVAALQSLGVPGLLQRFAAGETIAATDPAIVALHATATAHRGQLAAAAGVSPAKLATGTLRALLQAIGWRLEKAGRIHARGADRGAYTYRAQRLALPEGVDAQALAEVWLAQLRQPLADRRTGAFSPPIEVLHRGEKSATSDHGPPRSGRIPWPLAAVVSIPWAAGPPAPARGRPMGFCRGSVELAAG